MGFWYLQNIVVEVLITLGYFRESFEDNGRTTEILQLRSLPNFFLLMVSVNEWSGKSLK